MLNSGRADSRMAVAHANPTAIDADAIVRLFRDNGYRIDVYLWNNKNYKIQDFIIIKTARLISIFLIHTKTYHDNGKHFYHSANKLLSALKTL